MSLQIKKQMISHHQLISPPDELNRQGRFQQDTWVAVEQDAVGQALCSYQRRRSLRTLGFVKYIKRQEWLPAHQQVGVQQMAHGTAIVNRRTGYLERLTHRLKLKVDELPPGVLTAEKKRTRGLESLPVEDTITTWSLRPGSSTGDAPRRRATEDPSDLLSELASAGFVREQIAMRKEHRESMEECGAERLAEINQMVLCLYWPWGKGKKGLHERSRNDRESCGSSLMFAVKRCPKLEPQVFQAVGAALQSSECTRNVLHCMELINVLTEVATPRAQRILAELILAARWQTFPYELGALLITIERPTAQLLESLHTRLMEFFPTEECLERASSPEECFRYIEDVHEDARAREAGWQSMLLASAHLAGIKFTPAHLTIDADPGRSPARRIIAMYSALLKHVASKDDEWEQVHTEAEWRAQLHWDSLHDDAKYAWVAHHTNGGHKAMEWAQQNEQHGWHEEEARDSLRREHLHRHLKYDARQELQHKSWVVTGLRAVSNGAVPEHDAHVARWLRHRHTDVVHAAVDALRPFETPNASGLLMETLRAQLDVVNHPYHSCGHCPAQGYQRSPHVVERILTILTEDWKNVSHAVMSEAMRYLLRMPQHVLSGNRNHSHSRCTARCFSKCNPHLKNPCSARCDEQCGHEHTTKDLLQKLVKRGMKHGHDAHELLAKHAVAEAHPSLRSLLEVHMGIRIPSNGPAGIAYRRRLKASVQVPWELVDFNAISLTFLDVLLSLPPIDFKKYWGDEKCASALPTLHLQLLPCAA